MPDQLLSSATLSVDPTASSVGWSVKHLGVSTIRGTFQTFEGALEQGEATGAVAVGSVHTDDEQRDRFVRSDEFLGADDFPLMHFTGRLEGEALDGELTIRETTLPLTLRVEASEARGEGRALRLRGTVRRRAYGLRFHQAMGAADRSVGDEVELTLDLVLVPRA